MVNVQIEFSLTQLEKLHVKDKVAAKSRGPGISPGYYQHDPWLLQWQTKGKWNQKKIPSCSFCGGAIEVHKLLKTI